MNIFRLSLMEKEIRFHKLTLLAEYELSKLQEAHLDFQNSMKSLVNVYQESNDSLLKGRTSTRITSLCKGFISELNIREDTLKRLNSKGAKLLKGDTQFKDFLEKFQSNKIIGLINESEYNEAISTLEKGLDSTEFHQIEQQFEPKQMVLFDFKYNQFTLQKFYNKKIQL